MGTTLTATVETLDGPRRIDLDVDHLVIAGWAGRDVKAMEHHIRELEELGVARPKNTPTFYRVAASRLTTEPVIEELGTASSGEAEAVLIAHDGALLVGVGSDHTDRKVETYGVSVSKQLCAKPVSRTLWDFEDVKDHWDELILRSRILEDGKTSLYQEGSIAGLQPPLALAEKYAGSSGLPSGTAMFCGTLPALGGIRAATRFEAELEDPVLKRKITLSYEVASLEDAG